MNHPTDSPDLIVPSFPGLENPPPRRKLPLPVKIVLALGMSPVVLWPVAAGFSFMAADNAGGGPVWKVYATIFLLWTYPLLLLGNLLLIRRLYYRHFIMAAILLMLHLVPAVCMWAAFLGLEW